MDVRYAGAAIAYELDDPQHRLSRRSVGYRAKLLHHMPGDVSACRGDHEVEGTDVFNRDSPEDI